jgi:hypothetical protein
MAWLAAEHDRKQSLFASRKSGVSQIEAVATAPKMSWTRSPRAPVPPSAPQEIPRDQPVASRSPEPFADDSDEGEPRNLPATKRGSDSAVGLPSFPSLDADKHRSSVSGTFTVRKTSQECTPAPIDLSTLTIDPELVTSLTSPPRACSPHKRVEIIPKQDLKHVDVLMYERFCVECRSQKIWWSNLSVETGGCWVLSTGNVKCGRKCQNSTSCH